MTILTFKRGGYFSSTCYYQVNDVAAPLPASIRSQLRTPVGVLVEELVVTRVDEAGGVFTLTAAAANTALWKPQLLNWDILYADASGNPYPTTTTFLNVVDWVTHG